MNSFNCWRLKAICIRELVMATQMPYWFVQQMVVNELEYLSTNVNDDGAGYFSFDHLGDRLQNLIKMLSNLDMSDAYLQKYDIKSLELLIDNINKIDYTHSEEKKEELKQRLTNLLPNGDLIVSKYDKELNKVLNFSYNCEINTLNNIEMSHMKLACVLCYTALLPYRNNAWYLPNNEHQQLFAAAFGNYLINFLNMVKSKDGSLNKTVRVMYHVVPSVQLTEPYINLKDRMNASLIAVQNVSNAQYQNLPTDIEVCYSLNNRLYLNNSGDQQTDMCAEYLELNAVPYCLYNSMLPDNFAMSVFNLYKLHEAKKKLQLGNVLFVNVMRNSAKETIINTMRTYYSACQKMKNNKILRVVGNFKGSFDYKFAALDFAILALVTNATNCQLKYLTTRHEQMFMDLKQQICRLTPQKVYNVLLNYKIDKEPLTNFSKDAVQGVF
ncbi:ORF40 peptide [Hyphantria cunea nucleopolyhedrovirus]|uniref:ORF40 peptide n=1 Tax=Hyphantria cunea nuclear polyhedrosis virus TaxID=28288 RepID=Q2NNU9_NPVHC|nr:ORF40 peptide [Hyphantria cunea nucleopolyhedrovirus]BAE72329.1 ORF40 peptide [Hyphantria cunea nucleopolyhedrovirus]